MPRKRAFIDITAAFPPADAHRLSEIALVEGTTRSEIMRQAVQHFIAVYSRPEKEYESILEARLRKMENRLADLTVLAARASAQTLYYMTLPYSRGGLPTRPLKEEVFQQQWNKSRNFASHFLRHASVVTTPPNDLEQSA